MLSILDLHHAYWTIDNPAYFIYIFHSYVNMLFCSYFFLLLLFRLAVN